MGLAGQNQVRHMYVGDAPAGVSTFATLKSAGVASDLIILGADGDAVSAGGDFKLFQKDALGNVISSDTIKADNVLSAKSKAYSAPVLKSYSIAGLTGAANELVTVNVEILGHGSLSPEDTYLKQGFYKVASGDNAEAIVDGLIASLNRNFSREVGATSSSNPYFTFAKTGSAGSAALVITQKAYTEGFDGNKKTRVYSDFLVDVSADTQPTTTLTEGSTGVGTGHQVVEMEYFLLGERGDVYRTMGYPYNLTDGSGFASASSNYNLIEISYFDEGRNEAKKSKKQLTIAVPFTDLASNSKINTIVADLNTILGAGTVDTLAEA